MAFVEVNGYSFAYSPDSRRVVDDVSFTVEEGAFCVIVGATGSGKTTLLRSLKPELAPAGCREGSIRIGGFSLVEGGRVVSSGHPRGLSPQDSATMIGFVMQDPAAQIVCDTVWHELAFGLENVGAPQEVMRRRVAEVAHFFGIEPWVRSSTEVLSGGRQQLANLAALLAMRPRLLLLDEPTAQLDPHARRQFMFALSRVNRELGVTVVMAAHAPEEAEGYASSVIELGSTGPLGTRSEVVGRIRDRTAPSSPERPLGRPDASGGAGVEVCEAFFRYGRRDPWVIEGVDLHVEASHVHALVGGNGCGKTTLLKMMAGVLKPQRGRVENALGSSQAMLPQDPKALLVCDSAIEEVMEWSVRAGYDEDEARLALSRFGLAEFSERHPYDLSGGQQQKLALAKLLLCRPRLLLLDEPTKGLDAASRADVSRILRALADDEGKTVVLVTHDLDFALATADAVSMLFDGDVACTEPAQEFFAANLVYRPSERSRFYGSLLAGGAR